MPPLLAKCKQSCTNKLCGFGAGNHDDFNVPQRCSSVSALLNGQAQCHTHVCRLNTTALLSPLFPCCTAIKDVDIPVNKLGTCTLLYQHHCMLLRSWQFLPELTGCSAAGAALSTFSRTMRQLGAAMPPRAPPSRHSLPATSGQPGPLGATPSR